MNYNWVQDDYEVQSDAHLKLRGEIRRGGEWNMRNEQNTKVDQRQKIKQMRLWNGENKLKQETRGRIKTGKQEKRAKPIFGLHVSW